MYSVLHPLHQTVLLSYMWTPVITLFSPPRLTQSQFLLIWCHYTAPTLDFQRKQESGNVWRILPALVGEGPSVCIMYPVYDEAN